MPLVTTITDPLLQFFLSGRNVVSSKKSEFNIGVKKHLEKSDTIVFADGEKTISLADISPINLIILQVSTPEKTVNFKITVFDGVLPEYDITLPVNRLLVYEVGARLQEHITAFKYSTPSTTEEVNFTVCFYTYKVSS
jgi:hypothetical protein